MTEKEFDGRARYIGPTDRWLTSGRKYTISLSDDGTGSVFCRVKCNGLNIIYPLWNNVFNVWELEEK